MSEMDWTIKRSVLKGTCLRTKGQNAFLQNPAPHPLQYRHCPQSALVGASNSTGHEGDLLELGRAIVRQILVPAAAGDFNPQYSWEINLLETRWSGPIRFSW